MGDTLITVIVIILATILMFVFPVMTMFDRTDDMAQLSVETATTEFVDTVRTTGKLTSDNYNKYIEVIASTGYTYEVELEAKILDENPGKKTTQVSSDKPGENSEYSIFDSQILPEVNAKGSMSFKEGDYFSASVKNTNQSPFKILAGDIYTISARHGGLVTANASTK